MVQQKQIGLIKIIILLSVFLGSIKAEAQLIFSSLDSLLNSTLEKSTTLKSGEIKFTQAQKAKLASIAGILDLNGNITFNATENTRLPVSLFPAETFGGQAGTYQKIQMGTRFTNNFSQYAEVKILNINGWESLKLANINIHTTNIENKLNKKILFENIASAYYNILSLQEQLKSTTKSMQSADTIYQIVKNKFDLGLAKPQDINAAQVNLIHIKESSAQIEYIIQQQYIALKILCDIPESEDVIISQDISQADIFSTTNATLNRLSLTKNLLKEKIASTYYRQHLLANLPYISAFASNANQQFNNKFSLFDKNVSWINNNYIGLKAVWLIPTANTISQTSKAKYDYLLAKENTRHAMLESILEFQKLNIEFEKAKSQMNSNKKIHDLQRESFNNNSNYYKQGLLGLEQLINSYNAMLESHYNYISSTVSVMLAQSKIRINNQIQ